MNKGMSAFVLIICMLYIAGCGRVSYPNLPEKADQFEMGTFIDSENDGALYGTLEYEGRTYIGYGTINDSYRTESIDRCIGYIVKDESSAPAGDTDDKSRRVYTLTGDDSHNFLMDYDSTGLMDQPYIWRAVDTAHKDIEIPACIDSVGYEFWD